MITSQDCTNGPEMERVGQQLYLRDDLEGSVAPVVFAEMFTQQDNAHGYSVRRYQFEALKRRWFNGFIPNDRYGPRDRPFDGPTLGLEPVYRYLLLRSGCRLAPPFDPRWIGSVGQNQSLSDDKLLSFVAHHDRGQIRYVSGRVDLIRCLAAISAAFIEARIAVVVSSRKQSADIVAGLRTLKVAATEVDRGHGERPITRICVTRPFGLAEPALENAHLNLIICVDAHEAAGEKYQLALNSCLQARLFTFRKHDQSISPRNRDRIAATFGFASITLTEDEQTARPVKLLWLPQDSAGRLSFAASSNPVKALKEGVWRNFSRGRRVMNLARRLSYANHNQEVSPQQSNDCRATFRTVIMTAIGGHAELLHRQHPSVSYRPAPASCFGRGLRLSHGRGANVLLTTSQAAKYIDWSTVDALIWAGAGDDGPPLETSMLSSSAADFRPLFLLDIADKGHPTLATMTRRRRRRYDVRGWFSIDENPIDAEVTRFLRQPDRRVSR